MELDFTALFSNKAEKAAVFPSDSLESVERGNIPVKNEKPPESQREAVGGEVKAGRLLSYYEQEQTERERTRRAYSDYQRNIKESGDLRTEILNGVKAGEPAVAILLKAVKCIALMTGDTVFYSQAQGDIKSIYGAGLLDETAIGEEIRETKERLRKLQEARERDTETAESRGRIEEAIKAHKARIEKLEELQKKDEEAQR